MLKITFNLFWLFLCLCYELGGTWSANTTDWIPPRRAHISQAQDAALKFQVGKEMRKTEIFVTVLTTKYLHHRTD